MAKFVDQYKARVEELKLLESSINELVDKEIKKIKLNYLILKKTIKNEVLSKKDIDKIYKLISGFYTNFRDKVTEKYRELKNDKIYQIDPDYSLDYFYIHELADIKVTNTIVEILYEFFKDKEIKNKTAFNSFKRFFSKIPILKKLKSDVDINYQLLKSIKYNLDINFLILYGSDDFLKSYKEFFENSYKESKFEKLRYLISLYRKNYEKFGIDKN